MIGNWKFNVLTEKAWAATYKACEEAEKSIDFETYMLDDDRIGNKFLNLLSEKSKAGVKVRLLLDAFGSRQLYLRYLKGQVKCDDIDLRFFKRLKFLKRNNFLGWFFRDHRRILVVDSKLGFVGGICIDDEMKKWRDTQVSVEGRIIKELEEAFQKMWSIAHGGKLSPPEAMIRPRNSIFKLYTNAPHRKQRFFYKELTRQIREAKRNIYLTTPYFLPEQYFFELLQKKSAEGVDVRILVGTRSDHKIVDFLASAYFFSARRHGIKIFKFKKSIIHAKSSTIDGSFASVGSMNIDSLSLLFNHEACLVSTENKFIAETERQFLEDLENSDFYNKKKEKTPVKTALRAIFIFPIYVLLRIVGLFAYLLSKVI